MASSSLSVALTTNFFFSFLQIKALHDRNRWPFPFFLPPLKIERIDGSLVT